jgi:hypothetical protein
MLELSVEWKKRKKESELSRRAGKDLEPEVASSTIDRG